MAGDSGLRCPKCNSAWSEVENTIKSDNFVRRYRRCQHCHCRWPTTEMSHKPKSLKKKKDDIDESEDFFMLED